MKLRLPQLHPVTRRRLARFRGMRRAWVSLLALAGTYGASLVSELIANERPLYLRFEGRSLFPAFQFVSDTALLGEGHGTRNDYKELVAGERFRADPGNRVLWVPVPHGPREIIRPEAIALPEVVEVRLAPEPRVGSVNVGPDFAVAGGVAAGSFLGVPDGQEAGLDLAAVWTLSDGLRDAVAERFANRPAPAIALLATNRIGLAAELSMPPFAPRAASPRTVRLTLREASSDASALRVLCGPSGELAAPAPAAWEDLDEETRAAVRALALARFAGPVEPVRLERAGRAWKMEALREVVRYPFRPVRGHPLGLDSAGRDVLARLLYGLRTSMSFGLLLTAATLVLGTLFGAVQGYYGGRIDLLGQRMVEIWDAMPFLYVLMLMGSVYGRSFGLLLFCYALFNWIGISYYMRAEFLRLRRQPFVEAARALGLPAWRIMFRHILPNALVPLVTFFPFSLVSAIGTLAALDYLGFGLPPPTASWGELLAQAQEYPWAWWLALYPSLALFLVMLAGVFVGEGVRQAFDPKPYSRME